MTHPGKPKEIRITVRTPFRAVDFVQVLQRELQLPGKGLDPGPQIALGQRRELVEQGLYHRGVDHDHEELE